MGQRSAGQIDLGQRGSRARKRCEQCWEFKPRRAFRGKRDPTREVNWCLECRDAYAGGRRPERGARRRGLDPDAPLRVRWVERSGSSKLEGLPVAITSASTCPDACSFRGAGCYAEFHLLRTHWARVPELGLEWEAFLDRVRALERGTLWRYGEAGDLPGRGDALDLPLLRALERANRGRHGFTFTHKPLRSQIERAAIAACNRHGFTINLSADNLDHADKLARLGIAPVVVVVPSDAPNNQRTPRGRPVLVCLEQSGHVPNCARCGLCAVPGRKSIIAFRAHGQAKQRVSELVQLRTSRGSP